MGSDGYTVKPLIMDTVNKGNIHCLEVFIIEVS